MVCRWSVLTLTLVFQIAIAPVPVVRATQAPSSTTEKASRDWKRVDTEHFSIVTNASAADVWPIAEQLEVFRQNLVTRFLGLRTVAALPTLVVVLKDAAAFDRFKPRDEKGRKREFVGAYFMADPDMNFIVLPKRADDSESLRHVFHEYYHYIAHRNTPNLPTWLDEGQAEFYATSRFDPAAGKSVIGTPILSHILWLRNELWLPFDQLLLRDNALKLLRSGDARRVALFYAESWAFVHFLKMSDGGAREGQIKDYLAAIDHGQSVEQAFHAAFHLTYAQASQRLMEYVRSHLFPFMTITQSSASFSMASASTAMTEAEAQFVQGDLLLRLGDEDAADPLLAKALMIDQALNPAKIALGMLRLEQERTTEAIEILKAAADADGTNLRAHLALASAYRKAERHEDALREFCAATAINKEATAGWLGQAYAALALGRQDASDQALEHLQTLEPSPGWLQGRAYEAFRLGNFGAAARDARDYVAKAGPAAESSPYMAFLEAICLTRLGRTSDASVALARVRPDLIPGTWQERVEDYMQGKLPSDALLKAAKDVEQRTEAHAYVGFTLLQEGREQEALVHFRWVKEKGTKTYVEYGMAVAELKRLENRVRATHHHISIFGPRHR